MIDWSSPILILSHSCAAETFKGLQSSPHLDVAYLCRSDTGSLNLESYSQYLNEKSRKGLGPCHLDVKFLVYKSNAVIAHFGRVLMEISVSKRQ